MPTMPCQTCGGLVDLSKVANPDRTVRMYCSRSCATRMNNILVPKKGNTLDTWIQVPQKHEDGTYKTCMVCGEERATSHNSLFCSDTCRDVFWVKYLADREVLDKEARSRARARRASKNKECPYCTTMIQETSTTCKTHRWTTNAKSADAQKILEWLSGEWSGQYGPKTAHVVSPVVRRYLYAQCDYSCTKCGFSARHPDDDSPILQINHIDGDATNHSKGNLEVLCPNCHAMTPNFGRRNKNSTRPRNTSSIL